jgi:hypothetical protein
MSSGRQRPAQGDGSAQVHGDYVKPGLPRRHPGLLRRHPGLGRDLVIKALDGEESTDLNLCILAITGIKMKNTKHILAAATILMLTNCSSYKGAYDATAYINSCDAKANLKLKANMNPNISNKHKSLYIPAHVNLSDYIDPNVTKSKQMLPKYRSYLETDVASSYTKIANTVAKLKYTVLKANKAEAYIIISMNNNEKYKIQLEKFNNGSVIYILNQQNKIVLQSEFKELFKQI